MFVPYVLLQVIWCAIAIISSCDRTSHTTKLESKMLRIAYGRCYNHFTFYTQIEN
ncbi:MAG: hypothetical protein V7K92_11930 [Nostoc sp.]